METQQTTHRTRKLKALLVGGLVLGVGAAVTLAAWNDSEFATGTFGSGSFNLEGAAADPTTPANWSDHDTAPGAGLDFTLTAENMSPFDVVYSAFAVRLDANSTSDGIVTVTPYDQTGDSSGLSYGLVTTATFGCDQTAFDNGTELVEPGSAFNSGTDTFAVTAGAGTDPGDPVYLCYQVTADDTLTQNQSMTATWEFAAESQ